MPIQTNAEGAEWGGVWGEMFHSQPTRELGSIVSSLSGIQGRAPTENAFWRILKTTERSFLHLYADALSSPNIIFRGGKAMVWGRDSPPAQRKTAPNFRYLGHVT